MFDDDGDRVLGLTMAKALADEAAVTNRFLTALMPEMEKLGQPDDRLVVLKISISLFKIAIGVLAFNNMEPRMITTVFEITLGAIKSVLETADKARSTANSKSN